MKARRWGKTRPTLTLTIPAIGFKGTTATNEGGSCRVEVVEER